MYEPPRPPSAPWPTWARYLFLALGVALVAVLLWVFVIVYVISRDVGSLAGYADPWTLLPLVLSIAAIVVSVHSMWLSKRKREEERKRGFDVVRRRDSGRG